MLILQFHVVAHVDSKHCALIQHNCRSMIDMCGGLHERSTGNGMKIEHSDNFDYTKLVVASS